SIVWASILCGLAVLAKPTGIILGPILAVYLILKKSGRYISVLPGIGSILGFAAYGIYNEVRFANPLRFGPPWAFSLANVPAGVAGLLFSPAYGLLWFSPAAFLAIYGCYVLARRHSLEAACISVIFLGQLLVHSIWIYSSGGWSWGPRFLLPAL